jgi:hypothetical protein
MSTDRLFGQLIEVDSEQAGSGCLFQQSTLNGNQNWKESFDHCRWVAYCRLYDPNGYSSRA